MQQKNQGNINHRILVRIKLDQNACDVSVRGSVIYIAGVLLLWSLWKYISCIARAVTIFIVSEHMARSASLSKQTTAKSGANSIYMQR
jgi:hypothetical protein